MLDHRNIQPFYSPTHARYLRSRGAPVRPALGRRSGQQSRCLRLCPQPDRYRAANRGGRHRSPLRPAEHIQLAKHFRASTIATLQAENFRRYGPFLPAILLFRWPFQVLQWVINFSCAHRRPRFLDRIDIRPQIVAGDTVQAFGRKNVFSRKRTVALEPAPNRCLANSQYFTERSLRACHFAAFSHSVSRRLITHKSIFRIFYTYVNTLKYREILWRLL